VVDMEVAEVAEVVVATAVADAVAVAETEEEIGAGTGTKDLFAKRTIKL